MNEIAKSLAKKEKEGAGGDTEMEEAPVVEEVKETDEEQKVCLSFSRIFYEKGVKLKRAGNEVYCTACALLVTF